MRLSSLRLLTRSYFSSPIRYSLEASVRIKTHGSRNLSAGSLSTFKPLNAGVLGVVAIGLSTYTMYVAYFRYLFKFTHAILRSVK